MELIKTYTVTSKRSGEVWIFKYNQSGELRNWQILQGDITPEKAKYLFLENRFPYNIKMMLSFEKNLKKYFNIESKMPDVSFENFWNLYAKKSGKKESLTYWNKMPEAEQVKAILGIKKYKNALRLTGYKQPVDPIRYLRNERYNDE